MNNPPTPGSGAGSDKTPTSSPTPSTSPKRRTPDDGHHPAGRVLYSYQQSQFFKELTLEDQIREVGQNLGGADGIELIDEMSLRYRTRATTSAAGGSPGWTPTEPGPWPWTSAWTSSSSATTS
ncbi:hypothetical protein NKH77_55640 [Streptomyces sp. M19]